MKHKMKRALIISGGEYSPLQKDSARDYDYIIACDHGVEYAHRNSIVPDIIIGDMDSCQGEVTELFPDVSVLTFPQRKDDTDTMLAIKQAIEEGCDSIHICCGLGGRLDHTLANIQSLMYGSKQGCLMSMSSAREELIVLSEAHNSVIIKRREGFSLSLLALSDTVSGVCIDGTYYDTTDLSLTNCYPLGISNKWQKEQATISIASGLLLLINSSFD